MSRPNFLISRHSDTCGLTAFLFIYPRMTGFLDGVNGIGWVLDLLRCLSR